MRPCIPALLAVLSLTAPCRAAEPKAFPGTPTKWTGFARHDFKVDGTDATVVVPDKPLPADVAKAWKDAGATVGWMRVNENGSIEWDEKPKNGDVPALMFAEWKEGVIAKLPTPGVPFGINLPLAKITDAGVKELVAHKSLASLNLIGSEQVTDAGIKVLAALKNLAALNLRHCKQVTDAGVKELAALKKLAALVVGFTKVTDDGIKELQKAVPKCRVSR